MVILLSSIKLENLIEARKNLNLRQQDIAKYLSYDRSYYSKIENGLYTLKISDALKLCLLLNCDILYLYNIKRKYEPLKQEDRVLIKNFLNSNRGKF